MALMGSFKVGDLVKSQEKDGWTSGLIGTVVKVDEDSTFLVRFEPDQACGRGHGGAETEWYIDAADLVLVSRIKVGDRVRVLEYDGFRGRVGTVANDDGAAYRPFQVVFDDKRALWLARNEVEKVRKTAKKAVAKKAPHGPQEYLGNGKHEWEMVRARSPYGTSAVYRLRVPGGWLYSHGDFPVFVPVPAAVGYVV